MLKGVSGVLLAAHFTAYPTYGDRGIATLPRSEAQPRVEATVDRGPIVEVLLRCGPDNASAIISYSKLERRYCTPKAGCTARLAEAVERTCRRGNDEIKPRSREQAL